MLGCLHVLLIIQIPKNCNIIVGKLHFSEPIKERHENLEFSLFHDYLSTNSYQLTQHPNGYIERYYVNQIANTMLSP